MSSHPPVTDESGAPAVPARSGGPRRRRRLQQAPPAAGGPAAALRDLLHRVFALDLRSLAALRVGLAATLLLSLALQAPDIGAFFTDGGVHPRSLIVGGGPRYDPWRLSLHLMGGEWAAQAALLAAGAFCAVGMLVGWHTRLMTLLSWLLLMSLHNRNILVVSAGDGLLRILLLWAAFLPLGARFSVDAARASRANSPERPAEVSGVAGAALLLQLSLMYWFSAWFKQTPAWTTERTAVALALGIDELARPAIAGPLSRHPGLLARMTTATLAMEVAAPLAALIRLPRCAPPSCSPWSASTPRSAPASRSASSRWFVSARGSPSCPGSSGTGLGASCAGCCRAAPSGLSPVGRGPTPPPPPRAWCPARRRLRSASPPDAARRRAPPPCSRWACSPTFTPPDRRSSGSRSWRRSTGPPFCSASTSGGACSTARRLLAGGTCSRGAWPTAP
jgi:hypothetical protein